MDALDLAAQSAAVAALFVSQIEPDEEKMADSCSPELFATDIAYDLVRSGTAFRDAYREIAGKIADLPGQDPKAHLEHRTHQGTHGDLRLGRVGHRREHRGREVVVDRAGVGAHQRVDERALARLEVADDHDPGDALAAVSLGALEPLDEVGPAATGGDVGRRPYRSP